MYHYVYFLYTSIYMTIIIVILDMIQVAFYRGTSEVTPSPEIGVTNYTNVADAGIAEATITFRSPTNQVTYLYDLVCTSRIS